jgi:hypothetical protein
MTTDPAVPDGQPVQGTIVTAQAASGASNGQSPTGEDLTAHGFFNVIRHLVRSIPHVNEGEAEAALGIVDAFETHSLSVPLQAVVSHTDIAKREDVSQRRAPGAGTDLVPASGPGIDYNALAAALLKAQAEQRAQQEGNRSESA